MERDMDLVRAILLDLESHQGDGEAVSLTYEEWSKAQVHYHVRIMGEAGLLHVMDASSFDGPAFYPKGLTWEGHEFLEVIRPPSVWDRISGPLRELGTNSFEVVKAAAMKVAVEVITRGV